MCAGGVEFGLVLALCRGSGYCNFAAEARWRKFESGLSCAFCVGYMGGVMMGFGGRCFMVGREGAGNLDFAIASCCKIR